MNLKEGDSITLSVNISNINTDDVRVFVLKMYRMGEVFPAAFDLDNGFFGEGTNKIYLFKNGYQEVDRNLDEPQKFELFLINRSSENIDSVAFIENKLCSNKRLSDSLIAIYLPFKDVKENPTLRVFQNGKAYTLHITHNWNNWNINQEMYCLYRNGIMKKHESSVIE